MSESGQMSPHYPAGSVRALLATSHVSAATRDALMPRLESVGAVAAPRFFDTHLFATLSAACRRLIPQPDRLPPIDLAAAIDARLAEGRGDGWRYAAMPPDGDAFRGGLRGVDETARAAFGANFTGLDAMGQDAILLAVQRGEVHGGAWDVVPPRRFFEELLADAMEAYYSHPLAQEDIGYVGMADVPAWPAIGLDTLEEREPRASDDGAARG